MTNYYADFYSRKGGLIGDVYLGAFLTIGDATKAANKMLGRVMFTGWINLRAA